MIKIIFKKVSVMLNYMVIMTATLESNLTSVERIKEYTNTPKEVWNK